MNWLNAETREGGVQFSEVEINGEIYNDVTISVKNVAVSNNGIGAYEFHGARGYDFGNDFIDDFTYDSISVDGDEDAYDETLLQKIKDDQKIAERVLDRLNALL